MGPAHTTTIPIASWSVFNHYNYNKETRFSRSKQLEISKIDKWCFILGIGLTWTTRWPCAPSTWEIFLKNGWMRRWGVSTHSHPSTLTGICGQILMTHPLLCSRRHVFDINRVSLVADWCILFDKKSRRHRPNCWHSLSTGNIFS